MAQINENKLMDELSKVIDPILEKDLVSTKQIGKIKIKRGKIEIEIKPVVPVSPYKEEIESKITELVTKYEGIRKVEFSYKPEILAPLPKVGQVLSICLK